MIFSLHKHYLELYITDTAQKDSRSLYFFTTSISHGVENYFPRLWGTGTSDAICIPGQKSVILRIQYGHAAADFPLNVITKKLF